MPRDPNAGYLCYLIYSVDTGKIYVGSTNDIKRRLRQHNGKRTGGAKYTAKYRPWVLAAVVRGFATHQDALQFEWAWQHPQRSRHLKTHRDRGLISRSGNRCFSNWYKAAFYMCCVNYWRDRRVELTGYYIPPALVGQLTQLSSDNLVLA